MSGKPTVISTFAGCGGSSLGYKWAGFEELLAIEWDQDAAGTLKLNFPNVPVWQRDIRGITGKEILEFTGLKLGELDVLDGSPPCQGFSTQGDRNINDSRNDLSYEFIRLVNELKPKVFVMENVAGMVKGKMKGKFKRIMKALKNTGYNVKCKRMNAMHYEVPQSRNRLIFIGVKDGEPKYPKPLRYLVYPKKIDYKLKKYSHKRYGDHIISTKKPCPTLTRTDRMYWDYNNEIGMKSYLFIASFPEDYRWHGSYTDIMAEIGNAVMPKFMEYIAKTIKERVL